MTQLPFYGSAAVPATAQWLDHVRLRGETVPHLSKYCLMAFGGAMGIKLTIDHPAVRAAVSVTRLKSTKTAPAAPLGLIEKLEETECDYDAPQRGYN